MRKQESIRSFTGVGDNCIPGPTDPIEISVPLRAWETTLTSTVFLLQYLRSFSGVEETNFDIQRKVSAPPFLLGRGGDNPGHSCEGRNPIKPTHPINSVIPIMFRHSCESLQIPSFLRRQESIRSFSGVKKTIILSWKAITEKSVIYNLTKLC